VTQRDIDEQFPEPPEPCARCIARRIAGLGPDVLADSIVDELYEVLQSDLMMMQRVAMNAVREIDKQLIETLKKIAVWGEIEEMIYELLLSKNVRGSCEVCGHEAE